MIDNILSLLAPHHCYGCNNPPYLLCDNCKKYIVKSPNEFLSTNIINLELPPESKIKIYYIGLRKGVIKELINGYKFKNQVVSYKILGNLLGEALSVLNDNCILTSIPTSSDHIRKRGYDHVKLIINYITKKYSIEAYDLLEGTRKYYQHQKNLQERIELSQGLFKINTHKVEGINKDTKIIIIDDILTTGTTMKEAIIELRSAGFKNIIGLVIAYQDAK